MDAGDYLKSCKGKVVIDYQNTVGHVEINVSCLHCCGCAVSSMLEQLGCVRSGSKML